MVDWLKDAVFYEIYPQSFKDTNNDGIGDIKGMISKLDYIKSLGCNALWINPVYDSPFKDAGYDVRDYKKIAKRYGTNKDMYDFFKEAHKRDIKVLMDLVPGHTSDEHVWFKKSSEDDHNEYSKRYVWSNGAFEGIPEHPYVAGNSKRNGCYMLNFFVSQPALNYGWGVKVYPWQSSIDSKEAKETKEAIKDIMRFWLDKGCDGFRVDMADSLVKNDDDYKHATASIWKDIANMLDKEYPSAVMVSEWSNPNSAINLGGFDMDFYLDHWNNGYNTLVRDYEPNKIDKSYFKIDSGGDINRFLNDYLPKYLNTKNNGYISMFTCNHDTPRPARTLKVDELKLFYAFLFTMPGVPFLYYGDEIGMKYIDQESVEGGYHRTGSRTPMQWSEEKNYGFSNNEHTYTKIDTSKNAPTVSKQLKDKNSLLNVTKKLIDIRHTYDDLKADGDFKVLEAKGSLFRYQRGSLVCTINTSSKSKTKIKGEIIYAIGKIKDNYLLGAGFVITK